ncbi:MAG: trypsin-like peptidase domain-containing protein [Sulfurovum sp.]|nr:trypsin-like peptidase domain-containing protein [Sulfurovum sp.]
MDNAKRYVASVYAVSHQVDLALLKVEEAPFMEGVKPLAFGSVPQMEEKIVVYGYPMGGSTLSATSGVVSRVEHHTYAHSGESFLAVQVDAAVNPRNSGGPALSQGKIVGVVMQSISTSQNIGYLVPVDLVKHFIKDMQDGHYDGMADIGLSTQKLENPAMRRYYGFDENTTGKLINKVTYHPSLRSKIQEGDILTAVNGHTIQNDGTVEFRQEEYTYFHYIIDKYQMGESVRLDIIRDTKPLQIQATLRYTPDDMYLVKTTRYDTMPSYFVYGSYIFSPLTRNLIRSSKKNRLALSHLASQWQEEDKEEVVVLLKVLASDMSRGDHNFGMWAIDTLNGKSFKNFREFYERVHNNTEPYLLLEDTQGIKLIIDPKEAKAEQKKVLKKYNIEFPTSIELRKGSN